MNRTRRIGLASVAGALFLWGFQSYYESTKGGSDVVAELDLGGRGEIILVREWSESTDPRYWATGWWRKNKSSDWGIGYFKTAHSDTWKNATISFDSQENEVVVVDDLGVEKRIELREIPAHSFENGFEFNPDLQPDL